jgi:PKD repeat protein
MTGAVRIPPRCLVFSAAILLTVLVPSGSRAQSLDLPPEIAAPDTVTGIELSTITFKATTRDPEGDPIVFFYAGGLPIGASFVTNETNVEGTFTWTPGITSPQNFTVQLSATSARRPTEVSGVAGPMLTTTRNVMVRVTNLDRPPVLGAPDHVLGAQYATIDFAVQGNDPDGDPVTVTMSDVPMGATVHSFGATATFSWVPEQVGEYSVTTTVQSTVYQISETVPISVQPNRPPVLTGPSLVNGKEGEPVSYQVQASDPDGDEIVSLSAQVLPEGATFSVAENRQTGTFTWTPDYDAALTSRFVTISARSATRAEPVSGAILGYSEEKLVTQIVIENVDRPPVLPNLPILTVDEGSTLRQGFAATDPDRWVESGIDLTLFGPSFANLEQERYGSILTIATIVLRPGYHDAGLYTGRIHAQSGEGSAEATFDIVVQERNAPPAANPGGPYVGSVRIPIDFDGTGSSDPDGTSLTLTWEFGDGSTAVGVNPSHVFVGAGVFVVKLTVSDGIAMDTAGTTASVTSFLEASAFVEGGDRTTRLASGKPTTCVQLEPVAASFQASQVDLGSIVMISEETGALAQISTLRGKTTIGSDTNHNGEIEAPRASRRSRCDYSSAVYQRDARSCREDGREAGLGRDDSGDAGA